MASKTEPANPPPSTISIPTSISKHRRGEVGAAALSTGFLLLAATCAGVFLLSADPAVHAGATLLGVALAASSMIAILAGDP